MNLIKLILVLFSFHTFAQDKFKIIVCLDQKTTILKNYNIESQFELPKKELISTHFPLALAVAKPDIDFNLITSKPSGDFVFKNDGYTEWNLSSDNSRCPEKSSNPITYYLLNWSKDGQVVDYNSEYFNLLSPSEKNYIRKYVLLYPVLKDFGVANADQSTKNILQYLISGDPSSSLESVLKSNIPEMDTPEEYLSYLHRKYFNLIRYQMLGDASDEQNKKIIMNNFNVFLSIGEFYFFNQPYSMELESWVVPNAIANNYPDNFVRSLLPFDRKNNTDHSATEAFQLIIKNPKPGLIGNVLKYFPDFTFNQTNLTEIISSFTRFNFVSVSPDLKLTTLKELLALGPNFQDDQIVQLTNMFESIGKINEFVEIINSPASYEAINFLISKEQFSAIRIWLKRYPKINGIENDKDLIKNLFNMNYSAQKQESQKDISVTLLKLGAYLDQDTINYVSKSEHVFYDEIMKLVNENKVPNLHLTNMTSSPKIYCSISSTIPGDVIKEGDKQNYLQQIKEFSLILPENQETQKENIITDQLILNFKNNKLIYDYKIILNVSPIIDLQNYNLTVERKILDKKNKEIENGSIYKLSEAQKLGENFTLFAPSLFPVQVDRNNTEYVTYLVVCTNNKEKLQRGVEQFYGPRE